MAGGENDRMNSRLWKSLAGLAAVLVVAALVLSVAALIGGRRAARNLGEVREQITRLERQVEASRASLDPALTARFDELTRRLNEVSPSRGTDLDALASRLDEALAEFNRLSADAPNLGNEVDALAQRVDNLEAGLSALKLSQTPPDPVADVLRSATGEVVQTGSFVILQSGVPIGRESFGLYRSTDGFVLRSTGTSSRTANLTAFTCVLRTNEALRVEEYALRGSTPQGSLDALIEVGAEGIRVSVGAPDAMEVEILPAADVLLLDENIFAPFVLLERARQESGGSESLRVIVAQRARGFDLVISEPETVTLSTPTERLAAERWAVSIEGGVEAVYYVLDGRVVGAEIPREELFAYPSDRFPRGFLVERRSMDTLALPMGIVENEVTITSEGVKLAGTLTYPLSNASILPIVLLLPDLGPFDRNGDRPGLQTGILREVARGLAQMGIASYRLDARGTGKSGGDYSDASLDSLVADAQVAVFVLRALPFADRAKIYAFGFGTGGTIASLLASQGTTAGLITFGAPADTPDAIAVDELARRAAIAGLPTEEIERLVDEEEGFYRYVVDREGTWDDVTYEHVLAALPWMSEEELRRRRDSTPLKLMRDLLAIDPVEVMGRVKGRTLILQGDKDFQVPVDHAGMLARAASEGGNGNVRLEILPSINHVARLHSGSADSVNRHLDRHIDLRVLGAIEDWLSSDFELPPGGTGTPSSQT